MADSRLLSWGESRASHCSRLSVAGLVISSRLCVVVVGSVLVLCVRRLRVELSALTSLLVLILVLIRGFGLCIRSRHRLCCHKTHIRHYNLLYILRRL